MASANKNDIVFLPLGGVGEIGMNLALYGYGPEDDRTWLIVDCGVSFAGPNFRASISSCRTSSSWKRKSTTSPAW
ncbi:hypothetical protein OKA06_20250 [Novosphingobium sp. MW5]|nr:hypothetical protein [Novosphingobium sp. MW5]